MSLLRHVASAIVKALVGDLVLVCGYFDGNGASNPSTYVGLGLQATTPITRDGAGIYSIKLDGPIRRLLGAHFQVSENTPDNYTVCMDKNGSDVSATATTPTVLITHFDGAGAAADVASTGRVYFLFLCSAKADDR